MAGPIAARQQPGHKVRRHRGGGAPAEDHELGDTIGAVDRAPRTRGGVEGYEEIAGKERPSFAYEAAATAARLLLCRAEHRKPLANEVLFGNMKLVWADLR